MTSYFIPLITVVGAFGAAFAGQYFAHRYARKRENEKHLKESLQNLYSPLVYRVIDYLNEESDKALMDTPPLFREEEPKINLKTPDVSGEDTNKMFKNILTYIGEKLTYADQDLIMKYEIANKFGEFNYGQDNANLVSTIFTFRSRMELCSAFLSEYLLINKKLNTLSKRVKDEIESPFFFNLVLIILLDLRLHELAIDHGFKDKDIIISGFGIKRSLLSDAQTIYKRFNNISDNLEEFSDIEAEELEADAMQFILELINSMELFEPEISEFWRTCLEELRDKEEKRSEDFINKVIKKNFN